MGAYYLDSSALVKYYAREVGTDWVRSLIDASPANEIIIALVTGAEVVAAITRRKTVTRFRQQMRQSPAPLSKANSGIGSKPCASPTRW